MKCERNTIIIETYDEASEVYYAPTAWDNDPGGECSIMYAAQEYYNVPEEQSHEYDLKFATKNLELYYYNLSGGHNYYSFCFNTGKQKETYWPDEKIREPDNPYLIAALYMINEGIDNFELKHIIGDVYQAVVATNIKNGKDFMFKDTVDVDIYSGLKSIIRKRNKNEEQTEVLCSLSDFMSV